MIRNKRLIPAVAVSLLAAGVVGAQLGRGAESAKPTGKPIIIGGAIALSGGFSAYDLQNKVGSQVAVDNLNAAGGVLGRPLKYVTEDTKSDRSVGPTVALDLIDKGAAALIVQCDFDFGAPAALVAQQKKVPSFSCASSPKFGVQDIGHYAFDVGVPTNEEGAAMAEWSYKNLHARRAYFLVDTSLAYSKDECTSFEQAWKKLPGASVAGKDTFSNGDPSIASQITRLRSASPKPDLIGLCTYLPGGPNFIRQIRSAGITTPMISGVGIESRDWFKAIPHLSNYYYASYAAIFGNDPRPTVKKFFKDFQKKSGKAATNSYPVIAYTETEIIAKAIAKAGSTDGAAMVKALESFKNVPTLDGPVTYTPTRHFNYFPVAITEIRNGKPVFRSLVVPKKVPPPTF